MAGAPPQPVQTGSKRTAQEKADGEPRVKRKRVDHSAGAAMQSQLSNNNSSVAVANAAKQQSNSKTDGENTPSLFEFATLPTSSLYQYIIQHDLVPGIYPSPLSEEDPPPPAALADPSKMASRAPTPNPVSLATVANRPRRGRETKRRITRMVEEEMRTGVEQMPVLADVEEIHGVLASIASRHFKESSVKEADTLASFMCAVKAKNGRWL